MLPNAAGAFLITEISGPPDERNAIVLKRRALPFKPYTLKGTQRGEVTWYQGNPVGSSQRFGPAEEPTTVSGSWHDTYIVGSDFATLNGAPLADSRAIVVAIDNMRRQGKDVMVTWDEEIRVGYISSFERTWQRRTDVDYQIEFTWTSLGETELPPVVTPTVSISDVAAQTGGALEDIEAQFNELDFSASPKTLGVVNNQMAALKARQLEIQNAVAAAISGALAPLDAERRAVTSLIQMALDAQTFSQAMQANVLFSLRAAALPAQFAAGTVLSMMASIRAVRDSLNKMRDISLTSAALMTTNSEGAVLRELIGTDGDDLRRISQSVYGTAADWRLIALFNNVRTSRVSAGQTLQLPRSKRG